jgi:hypothetical protein
MFKKFLVSLFSLAIFAVFGVSFASAVSLPDPFKLKIITAPQTIEVGATSSVFTVETQDLSGNAFPVYIIGGARINLSSDSSTGSFSSKSSTECGIDWTINNINISFGDKHRSFCYKDSTPGTHTITVAVTGTGSEVTSPDSQTITINSPVIIDNVPPVIVAPADQTFPSTGTTTTPVLVPATATDDSEVPPVITYNPHDFLIGTSTVVWTATDESNNFSTTSSLVIITTNSGTTSPEVTPSVVGGSNSGGGTGCAQFLPGTDTLSSCWLGGVIANSSSTTGRVLGTSTEKMVKEKVVKRKLTPEEKKTRVFKKKLNLIKIAIYELKHPESKVPPVGVVFGTSTQTSSVGTVPLVPTDLTVSDSGEIVGTGTDATTTPKKKPFWKLW